MKNFLILFSSIMVILYLGISVFLVFFAQQVLGERYNPNMKWFGLVVGGYGLIRTWTLWKQYTKNKTSESN